jgi:hypothetical protein
MGLMVTSHHLGVPFAIGQKPVNCAVRPVLASAIAARSASACTAGQNPIQGRPRRGAKLSHSIRRRPLALMNSSRPSGSSTSTQSGLLSARPRATRRAACRTAGMAGRSVSNPGFHSSPESMWRASSS